jgi:hypothetical protein
MKNKVETLLALFLGIQFLSVLIFFHNELGLVGCGILGLGLFVSGMYVENSYVRSTLVAKENK